ncbi:MAG: glycosyltransferase family 9 protein [bacterium]
MEKILIIHRGALGDFILAQPALKTLVKYHPNASFALMGNTSILKVASNEEYYGTCISFDLAGIASFYSQNQVLNKDLTDFFSSFDCIFIFTVKSDAIFIYNLERIGCKKIYSIPFQPDSEKAEHIIDCQLNALADMGYFPNSKIPRISVYNDGPNKQSINKPYLVFHPGSGGRRKIWPEENMVALIEKCNEILNAEIRIIQGEADELPVSKIAHSLKCAYTIIKDMELTELALLLSGSRGYIGNDSGISHLVAAARAQSVVVFGPTDPNVWGPRGENVRILWKGIPCSPCYTIRDECQSRTCLYSITPDDVWNVVSVLFYINIHSAGT